MAHVPKLHEQYGLCQTLPFPSSVWNLGKCQAERYLCDNLQWNSEHWVSHELPWLRQHFTHAVTTHCWGSKHILFVSTKKGFRRLYLVCPRLCSKHLFSLPIFLSILSLLIHHSHEYDYMVHPVHSPRKSPTTVRILRTMTQEYEVNSSETYLLSTVLLHCRPLKE